MTWLKARNRCKSKTCLLTAYQTRVEYFESVLAYAPKKKTHIPEEKITASTVATIPQGNTLILKEYKDKAFCEAISKPLTQKQTHLKEMVRLLSLIGRRLTFHMRSYLCFILGKHTGRCHL